MLRYNTPTMSDQGPPSFELRPARLALALGVGFAVFFAARWLPFQPGAQVLPARITAGVTALTAACWLGAALPIGAASLLPLALMPMLGAMPVKLIAPAYAHPIVWMFFGGFVLALGIERWGLHRRIALRIVQRAGVVPSRLILGFMAAAGFLSLWLNNTATMLLLFPVLTALVRGLRDTHAMSEKGHANFAYALLLGTAYACSIGGIGTPIGTAPNALFLSQYDVFRKAGAPAVTFVQWMAFGIPLVAVFIVLAWLVLTRLAAPQDHGSEHARVILEREASKLPPVSPAERRMAALFVAAAVLWVFRSDIALGSLGTVPGWWRLTHVPDAEFIGDGAVAVLVALLAFVVPAGTRRGQALMDWQTAKGLPWDILLLIGGGIAIADSFTATGLAGAVGATLAPLAQSIPPFGMLVVVCLLMTFLTEVTSNTAITALMLPVIASMSSRAGVDPRIWMLGATISASCAFMLPIGTPPNAIAFGTGQIPITRMARTGLWMNLAGVALVSGWVWFVAAPVMGVDVHARPGWNAGTAPSASSAHP